jgi:alpha-L-fucosidase 2
MGGTWLTTHLWEHFLYSCDTAFLLDYAYPLMRGASIFCLDYLVPAPDGYLVTAPSTSPENLYITDSGYTGACLYGSTSDIAMIRELFNNMLQAASIAGDDELGSQIRQKLDALPPYRIGKRGNLQEWYHDWDDQDPRHRHLSHLFGLYPGHSISPEIDPEIFQASRRALELRTNNGTGWSIAWKIGLWARLLDGDMALDAIDKILYPVMLEGSEEYHGGGTYPNLFDAHPPFQIDGNFGATAGIAEMIIQSKVNEITLLPAIPAAWPNGKVSGLRARGGYTVDISWKNAELQEAVIVPDQNGPFSISYGNKIIDLAGNKGEKVTFRP